MCIIIDTNRFINAFSDPPDPDAGPMMNWINSGKGIVVFGGRLLSDEITLVARRWLKNALQAGRARLIDTTLIEKEVRALESVSLRSDDPHILALARASKARLLYTKDTNLMADFKNVSIIRPKGRIYQNRRHAAMLQNFTCRN